MINVHEDCEYYHKEKDACMAYFMFYPPLAFHITEKIPAICINNINFRRESDD